MVKTLRKYGILIISHGSRSRQWVEWVEQAASRIRTAEGMPVYCSYLEIVEGRLIQDGIDALEGQGVTDLIVVPLFVSSGSTHVHEIAYALGVLPEPALETDLAPFSIQARVHLLSPIDEDPVVAEMLYGNIRELSADPSRETVLLIGHGSKEKGFHTRWRQGLQGLAARLKELGGFAGAEYAMLLPNQIPCAMKLIQRRHPEHAVIAVPLFLSEGYFTKQVIPSRMEGYDYRYNGRALLPNPLVTDWMERQIGAFWEAQKTDAGD